LISPERGLHETKREDEETHFSLFWLPAPVPEMPSNLFQAVSLGTSANKGKKKARAYRCIKGSDICKALGIGRPTSYRYVKVIQG
jgi:hypothetical protein